MPKGRPEKPLSQKIAEGARIRNDRINRDAPVPPAGCPAPPAELSPAEVVVWETTLRLAAPGQIRPLDGGLLRRYCWTMAEAVKAMVDLDAWRKAPKREGETEQLVRARNGEMIAHPLFGLIGKLQKDLDKQEAALGLNPVSREKIRASIQADLFDNPDGAFAEFVPKPPALQ